MSSLVILAALVFEILGQQTNRKPLAISVGNNNNCNNNVYDTVIEETARLRS